MRCVRDDNPMSSHVASDPFCNATWIDRGAEQSMKSRGWAKGGTQAKTSAARVASLSRLPSSPVLTPRRSVKLELGRGRRHRKSNAQRYKRQTAIALRYTAAASRRLMVRTT